MEEVNGEWGNGAVKKSAAFAREELRSIPSTHIHKKKGKEYLAEQHTLVISVIWAPGLTG